MVINRLILCALPIFLVACGSTGIHPVGGGLYFVSQRSWQVELGYTPVTKATLRNEAEAFCADRGKMLVPNEIDVQDSALLRNGRVSMTFGCEATREIEN